MNRYRNMIGAMVARDAYSTAKRYLRRRLKRRRAAASRRPMLRGSQRRVRRRTVGPRFASKVKRIIAADKPTLIHEVDWLNSTIDINTLYSTRLDDIGRGTETGGNEFKRDGWTIDLRGFKIEYYLKSNETAGMTYASDMRMLILADYTDYNETIPVEQRFFEGSGDGSFASEALDFSGPINLHQKLNRKINGRRYKVVMDKRIVLKPAFNEQVPVKYGKVWLPRRHLMRFHEVTQDTTTKEVPRPVYRICLFYQNTDNVQHAKCTATIKCKTYFKNH